jgi:hypothetical protein
MSRTIVGAKDYIGDVTTANLILKLNTLGQNYLREIVKEHGIECQMTESGKYQAAVGEEGDRHSRGLPQWAGENWPPRR